MQLIIYYIGSIQLGLLYGLMAMGIYITFRILNIPDLTVDGSFTLGMAVAAVFTIAGHPFLALLLATICGALAGSVTGFLQTKAGIHPILAGILVMTGLYTVNLAVMGGKANLSLFGKMTLFTQLEKLFPSKYSVGKTLIALTIAVIVIFILILFFKTRLGLAIRATGDNEDMVRSSSINAGITKIAGLALGNACVALTGALVSQHQVSADVGYGKGMVVIGLAAVIIGETILGKRSVSFGFLTALIGSVIYYFIRAVVLKYSFFPPYAFNLISALIVAVALSLPTITSNWKQNKIRKGGAYAGTKECK